MELACDLSDVDRLCTHMDVARNASLKGLYLQIFVERVLKGNDISHRQEERHSGCWISYDA